MINNFEEYTHDLTEQEINIANLVKTGLQFRVGKNTAITNKEICKALLTKYNIKISDSRMRAIIHYIRIFLLPDIIATSKGYYRTSDVLELQSYADSLTERIGAIQTILNQIKHQIYINQKQTNENI
jgi:hypothetical protein